MTAVCSYNFCKEFGFLNNSSYLCRVKDRIMAKKHEIRNSTAEFLIFQAENKEQGIEVMYADETIWCTQDAIAALFDKGRSTIAEHLQNTFNTGELLKDSVCRKFRRTAADGKEYNTQYYSLDAVISVGYRVNSLRATQFRQWATSAPCLTMLAA